MIENRLVVPEAEIEENLGQQKGCLLYTSIRQPSEHYLPSRQQAQIQRSLVTTEIRKALLKSKKAAAGWLMLHRIR